MSIPAGGGDRPRPRTLEDLLATVRTWKDYRDVLHRLADRDGWDDDRLRAYADACDPIEERKKPPREKVERFLNQLGRIEALQREPLLKKWETLSAMGAAGFPDVGKIRGMPWKERLTQVTDWDGFRHCLRSTLRVDGLSQADVSKGSTYRNRKSLSTGAISNLLQNGGTTTPTPLTIQKFLDGVGLTTEADQKPFLNKRAELVGRRAAVFPQPRPADTQPAVPHRDHRWTMVGRDDPRGHFTSRAQGYQGGYVRGADRFRGRQKAVDTARAWVLREQPPGRPLVITGQPGAGKSAVLARVILDLEQASTVAGVAVHARDATLEHVVAGIAQAAGLTGKVSRSELYDTMKDNSGTPLVIAVDALDEVPDVEQRREIVKLLTALAGLPLLRVAVATRPLTAADRYTSRGLLPALGVLGPDSSNLVDLDAAGYLDPDGLRQFILAVLTGDGIEPPSPYRDQLQAADRLAELIAERASSNHHQPGSNYLVAALAATSLTGRDQILDPDIPGFDPTQIPSTVGEAITKYSDRLGEGKAVTMGLLTALAYAQGSGLDHDRWITFTKALGYPADAADVATLRDSPAADYLLQTITNDHTLLTRLFHQALTDELLTLRQGLHHRDQKLITQTLLPAAARYWTHTATAPAPTGPRGWTYIDDYTRQHLPTHAAAGRLLDQLMTDPGFLLACPPERILQHRHTLTDRDATTAAAALEATATSDWAGWDADRRAWWLHVWVRKTRIAVLADALITNHPAWSWHVHTAIWSGSIHRTLTGHTGEVWAVAAWTDSDGRTRIASGSEDETVRVWDPETGEQLAELVGHTGEVNAVAGWTDPDGRTRIVSGSEDETLLVWDPETGEQLAELVDYTGTVHAVAVWTGPNGRTRIASGSDDRTVGVWDPDTGRKLGKLVGHTSVVYAVAWWAGTDGRTRIASGSSCGTVLVWDPETGEQLAELTGDMAMVWAVAGWTGPNDRTRIAHASEDWTLRVWDPESEQLAELIGHTDGVAAVAVWAGPDGRIRIVSGSGDETVRVWNPETGEQLAKLVGHTGSVRAVAVWTGTDGRPRIASGSDDETVRVWDPESEQLAELVGHTGTIYAMAVWTSTGGRARIASGSADKTVRVWDPETGEQLAEFTGRIGVTGPVHAVAVWADTDGRARIASGGEDETVRVWDPETGEQLAELTGHTATTNSLATWRVAVWAVAGWAGTGGRAWIASGGDDGTVRVWDPETGEQLAGLTGHTGPVRAMAVWTGTDGRPRIASGSDDWTVRVWDPETGEQPAELTDHTGPVRAMAVWTGTDGPTRIVSGGDDETVRVWDPETGEQLAELTGHTGPVRAMAVWTGTDGRPRIASGSDDRTVMVWVSASHT